MRELVVFRVESVKSWGKRPLAFLFGKVPMTRLLTSWTTTDLVEFGEWAMHYLSLSTMKSNVSG
jgi:hypothetical protein